MGVKFWGDPSSFNNFGWVYTPEKIDDRKADIFRELKKCNMETNGYSKGRTQRLECRIPDELLYNYCGFHGVNPNTRWDWIKNKKNRNQFLSEFPVCKMVDAL